MYRRRPRAERYREKLHGRLIEHGSAPGCVLFLILCLSYKYLIGAEGCTTSGAICESSRLNALQPEGPDGFLLTLFRSFIFLAPAVTRSQKLKRSIYLFGFCFHVPAEFLMSLHQDEWGLVMYMIGHHHVMRFAYGETVEFWLGGAYALIIIIGNLFGGMPLLTFGLFRFFGIALLMATYATRLRLTWRFLGEAFNQDHDFLRAFLSRISQMLGLILAFSADVIHYRSFSGSYAWEMVFYHCGIVFMGLGAFDPKLDYIEPLVLPTIVVQEPDEDTYM